MKKIDAFLKYLKENKNASDNTLIAYGRDIRAFEKYMSEKHSDILSATQTDVLSYIMQLSKNGKSRSTTNRKLASLRAFFDFNIKANQISINPTDDIKTPRAERKEIDYLSISEVEELIKQPSDSIKGYRDRAILEVLYGTGIRVMELIDMNTEDINLRMGFITCQGIHGKARIVPLGKYAKEAMKKYMEISMPSLLKKKQNDDLKSALFVNYMGERFTRQGLWKILKQYGKAVGMEDRITPHILRTSFAVHMIQNGADLKTLQELLGYDDMQALQVFMQLSKSRIKDVYDRTHPRA
ncbi:MAG: tyrosine-type recombinase/integrase [Eubacterium sp.]|nr:tyrosine-type recombinase/integrase [Eubacterium sp.]